MTVQPRRGKRVRIAVAHLALAAMTFSGCQSQYAGQVLPSPWYLEQDVQYFPPGPEFKLSKTAAAIEANRAESISEPQQQ